jgi:excisionase family DNA binding protein
MVSPPELLSVRQVAELSGVDRRTVWRWVDKGAVPHLRVGPTRRIRIARRDAECLICPNSQEAHSTRAA